MNLDLLNETNILSDEVMDDLYDETDLIERDKKRAQLRSIAKKHGLASDFDSRCRSYEKMLREQHKAELLERQAEAMQAANCTKFSDLPEQYHQLECGAWYADDAGVRINSREMEVIYACQHPIMPVERLKNLQTGFEQMKIIYKRDGKWQEHTFPKDVLSSANKIVGLSNYGIIVTTESAKFLVRYFSDVEARSSEYIAVRHSSSKFGWINGTFLPYDMAIEFDAESRFYQLSDAIHSHGDYEKWLRTMRDIRRSGSFPVRIMMAASFASVILEMLGALPYFVDLWGDTEGGKTVTLMVACSIWADPSENKYIGDFKSTDVALETKANVLNNLPMILDDTSKTSARMRENFEGFVYDMTSGKGKSRSDRDLGIRYENNWRLSILTTGEAPLNNYVNQGGAINRILEVKADEKLFSDPQGVVETIRNNYGFAGKAFVDAVKTIGSDEIKRIFSEKQKQIETTADKKMQKQVISLATILTADQIATDSIFADGIYLDVSDAVSILVDPEELSVNERAYQFLQDKIRMNEARFHLDNDRTEQWGIIDSEYAYIYPAAFNSLCQQGGFSRKSFTDWAIKRGNILPSPKGETAKAKKINGKTYKCIWLKLQTSSEEDDDGFVPTSEPYFD